MFFGFSAKVMQNHVQNHPGPWQTVFLFCVYMFGLFLEGARFDRSSWLLHEGEPGKMFDLLPCIHFKPAVLHKQPPGTYATPVYKTAVRKGVLSTTGMSTNFVVAVELPTAVDPDTWVLAGVAALLNLTD